MIKPVAFSTGAVAPTGTSAIVTSTGASTGASVTGTSSVTSAGAAAMTTKGTEAGVVEGGLGAWAVIVGAFFV